MDLKNKIFFWGVLKEENIGNHVAEILKAWTQWLPAEGLENATGPSEDVDVRLAQLLESQSLPTTTQKSYTEEERRIRESILAQYSEMPDQEESDCEGVEEGASGTENKIEKNRNAASIVQLEREKRERAKLESQKKKEKDKEDRCVFKIYFPLFIFTFSNIYLTYLFVFILKNVLKRLKNAIK